MSISGYSPYNDLFGSRVANPGIGNKRITNGQNHAFKNMLNEEMAPPQGDKVTISSYQNQSPASNASKYSNAPFQVNANGSVSDHREPAVIRFAASLGFPDWVANVCYGGDNNQETRTERSEFTSIVMDCFKEVKKEFGCDDSSYLPYHPSLPEYDKDIAEQMKAAFYEKIEANSFAESLSEKLGVAWPPEKNTEETAFNGFNKIGAIW